MQSYLARSSSSPVTAPRGAAPANGAVPPANGAVPLANGARVSTAVVPATVVTAGTHEDRFHRLEQVVTELTASGALAAPSFCRRAPTTPGWSCRRRSRPCSSWSPRSWPR